MQLQPPSEDLSCPSEQGLLYREWAPPRSTDKQQPLDLLRKFYGEKVGIYFAWLGYYTQTLLPAAVVGVACFLYGYFNQNNCTWRKKSMFPLPPGESIIIQPYVQVLFFWCDPGGCLLELMTQLTIIVGGKAIWNNIQEVLLLVNTFGCQCVLPHFFTRASSSSFSVNCRGEP
ncbi:anoctamin-6-like isoform X2 [Vicugna pacos]|uniref:Anoctamin n=1 Tax=Vicugna pacos TaxID=30538 RepID=A0ABM5C6W9_VICPA